MILTPVEQHANVLLKRDDLFQPYGPNNISGGKARQAIAIFESIKVKCPGVVSCSALSSPQGVFVSQVARRYDMKCIITCGGSKPETMFKHPFPRLVKMLGAEYRSVCGTGQGKAPEKRSRELAEQLGYYFIPFAIDDANHPQAVYCGTVEQVKNIPDELDVLVVPVGSGIQMSCILAGLELYGKRVKRIVGVWVGHDRREVICKHYQRIRKLYQNLPNYPRAFEMASSGMEYNDKCFERIGDIQLNPTYEAKAYKWLRLHFDIKKSRTLFWIVGRGILETDYEKWVL